ncbi:MAG: CHAT domain-containing protein [Myxococcota bacterium]
MNAEQYLVPEVTGVGLRVFLSRSSRIFQVEYPGATPWTLGLHPTEALDELEGELATIDELQLEANTIYASGGDWREARATAERTIDLAINSGRNSKAVDIALMSVFFLGWHAKRPDLATELLARIHDLAMLSPQNRADWHASSGHVHWGEGNIGEAALHYRLACQHALKMNDSRLIVEAIPMYAAALAELGYFRASAHWSHHALDFVEPGSEVHGQVLETAGWVDLVLAREGHAHADPADSYERAIQIFGPQGSFPSPYRLGPALLGLAEARLLEGAPVQASAYVEQVADEWLIPDDRAYRHDLELRIGLRLGLSEAYLGREFAMLEDAAQKVVSPEASWWVATRRGDLRARAGRWQEAATAYRAAEDQLDRLVRLVAFGLGRQAIGRSHNASAIGLAKALIELDRPAEALCTLREAEGRTAQFPTFDRLDSHVRDLAASYTRAQADLDDAVAQSMTATTRERRLIRAKVSRQIDKMRGLLDEMLLRSGQHRGRPRCDQLSPVQSGELLLGLYPAADHWLVFSQSEDETIVHRAQVASAPADDPEVLAATLLKPITEQLSRAHRLRVVASGAAKTIDVQTLPWRGRPLLEAITVVHGTERVPRPLSPSIGPPRAVLIADPTHTLPEVENELAQVADQLHKAGYLVESVPQEHANVTNIKQALQRADLVHFAGHSQYPTLHEHGLWPPYAAGNPGKASTLRLTAGQQMATYDISLLAPAPRVVVLVACQAGVLDPSIGGPSLAHAFITGGAQVVIASPDILLDDRAAAFGRELYAHLPKSGPLDAAEALRQAQRQLWDVHPDPQTHIGRYRAWVP